MPKRLNLDELYGHEPLEVEWQGQVYELKHLRALGPLELAQFERLHNEVQGLLDADELSTDDAERFEEAVRNAVNIICPDLTGLPFGLLAQVLAFYGREMSIQEPVQEPEKKAPQ
ncbi:hypothetical protein D6833_08345 [Candidatus Parcubacteria bacterium]|nr:MAG: hypothetical protein D6833_08345 [Candidatus Parcubacteria bacterium]